MNEYQTEMLVVVLVFAFLISIISAVMCTIRKIEDCRKDKLARQHLLKYENSINDTLL